MSVRNIASYDIWDTVLRRSCHPDTVKVQVARLLILLGKAAVKPHLRDPWILFHFRQNVERSIGETARNAGLDDEYDISEVIRAWIVKTTSGMSDYAIDMLAEELIRAELEIEKSIIYADPTIEDQFSVDASRRRIFVSDFYMGKNRLLELLEAVGVARYFHDGYVSCDTGFNKRSGRLFQHVLEAEACGASSVRHWGDNSHSDVTMPVRHGIEGNHYMPAQEHATRIAREQRFHQRQTIVRSLIDGAVSSVDDVSRVANQIAPLFVGFMLHVQEQIVSQRLEKVFFFTREGEFFVRIYEALRAASPFAARLPQAELLEVSRIATFGPSLAAISAAELMRVWNLYSTQSPRAFLNTVDLSPDSFGRYFTRHGMELDVPIQYPWQDERMVRLLADSEFVLAAESQLAERRSVFLRYCAQRGLDSTVSRCAVVDIGWRGTIQDNIASMLPATHFSGFYLGLSKLLNQQPANTTKDAFGPDLNVIDIMSARRLLEFVAPLEMLTNSPSGSVIGYESSKGKVVARKLVSADENDVFETFTSELQERVVEIARRHAEHQLHESLTAADYREIALKRWAQLIRRPDESIARAYFSLTHNETFGVGGFVKKSDGLGYLWPVRLLLSPRYRKGFRARLSKLGWTEGYVAVKKDRLLIPILNTFYKKKS